MLDNTLLSHGATSEFCCFNDCAQMVEVWEMHLLIPMDRKRKHHGIITLGSMFIIKGVSHHSPFKGLAKRRKIAMEFFASISIVS